MFRLMPEIDPRMVRTYSCMCLIDCESGSVKKFI